MFLPLPGSGLTSPILFLAKNCSKGKPKSINQKARREYWHRLFLDYSPKRETALSRHHTEVGSWIDGLLRCLFQHHEESVNDHMELRTVTLANG